MAARRGYEASFCCGQFARELRCPSCNGQRTAPRAVNRPHWAFLLARVRHRCTLPLVAALFAAFAEWLLQLFFSAALVGRCFSAAACSRFIGRFRWLLSPAVAVGRFHWPLSLATYWPLHSAVLVGPPTQPARRNSIFPTYLRRRLAGQHVRRRTQRTRHLHSSQKSARPVKPGRQLGRPSRRINADDNRTGRRRAFARRASRRPAPVRPKSRCRQSSCARLAFRRRATGSARNPGSRRARPHDRG